jgi:hypothetical protein
LTPENDSSGNRSARAQLIRTRRGAWIDETLLPEARRECLAILREAARTTMGQDAYFPGLISDLSEAIHSAAEDVEWNRWYSTGDLSWVTEKELLGLTLDVLHSRGVLDSIIELDLNRGGMEEVEAGELAKEARATVRLCGCCGWEFVSRASVYFGAEVYIGMMPLDWNKVSKPRICEPQYERTVLCESCAPEWLSPERDDVVTQLCAYCERPMVSRLALSELRRTLCSDTCRLAYQNQMRKEKRAKERSKVCEVCGEEFTATRRDSKTCSDGCRQKAYRRRRKEAQQDR